jgi:hypothetical protein
MPQCLLLTQSGHERLTCYERFLTPFPALARLLRPIDHNQVNDLVAEH